MAKSKATPGDSRAAELLNSMRDAQDLLQQSRAVRPGRLFDLISGWRSLVEELAIDAARGKALATLYEISRVLNSSLDLAETLGRVMDSLIRLTGAERGCLLLIDEAGNLERVAARSFEQVGGDAADLQLSLTVVEQVVRSGEAVVTTNAQLDPRFSSQDSVIGLNLRSIACVPLYVRDQAIGALYLDNRFRAGVFSQADLPGLTAFANQAAVAIENARLYTRTDQELAARVEELTTLQQIDRDLSATLDLDCVLDLTLTWAIRATGAESGAVGLLEDDGSVHIRSMDGSTYSLETGTGELHLATEESHRITRDGRRLLVPIRWHDRTWALLDLRHAGDGGFLLDHARLARRIADRAAVAIENAQLYENAREANRAKSEFVSVVAHELRTPMTSIRGYAGMLAQGIGGTLQPDQEQFVDTIIGNVERMRVLVSDLQDVSRLETGQIRLEPTEASLAAAVQSAMQTTQAQMQGRAQQLTIDLPEDLPPVRADPARLAQVLINLLSNAHKYTQDGGQISVCAWSEDDQVLCAVSDTGIGMSPDDQAELFTKFFRSSHPDVQATSGTGLGLCIVKSLVELQGGQLHVNSALGEGSTFTFTLPTF